MVSYTAITSVSPQSRDVSKELPQGQCSDAVLEATPEYVDYYHSDEAMRVDRLQKICRDIASNKDVIAYENAKTSVRDLLFHSMIILL